MEITFKPDKNHRDAFFTKEHFAHPAKMLVPLLLWIIDNHTMPGDVIADPMAGSGTAMLGCRLGRNVILNELEAKFVKMQEDNWAKVQTFGAEMGYAMGWCKIIQGDARQLGSVLADCIVSSPPYALTIQSGHEGVQAWKVIEGLKGADNKTLRAISKQLADEGKIVNQYGESKDNIGNLPYGNLADVIVSSPPYAEAQSGGGILAAGDKPLHGGQMHTYRPENAGESEGQISQLPYGSIDAVITSPPYEEAMGDKHHSPVADKVFHEKGLGVYTNKADCVITSPPYENQGQGQGNEYHPERIAGTLTGLGRGYSDSPRNIGNLKGQTYLSAMLEVYQACYRVLKPQGLMILVTKNFIRNKQIVKLDEDTIKIAEKAGFKFQERHYRKLTTQSFWRTIYKQKYPEAPEITREDILVFERLTR